MAIPLTVWEIECLGSLCWGGCQQCYTELCVSSGKLESACTIHHPNSMLSDIIMVPKISHGGSVYIMEISKSEVTSNPENLLLKLCQDVTVDVM